LLAASAVVVIAVWPLHSVDTVALHGSLNLGAYIMALLASLGFYVRWRMSGEAPTALIAAALAVASMPPVFLRVVPLGADVQGLSHATQSPTQLVAMLPAALLLARAARAPRVDTSVNPVGLTVVYGTVATASVIGLSLARTNGLIPEGAVPALVADILTGVLAVALAAVFSRHAPSLAPAVAARLATALSILALSTVLTVAARVYAEPLWVVAGYVGFISSGLVFLLALAVVRDVLNFTGERLLTLGLRADSAEEAVRLEQERLHELRATIAGLRGASVTLSRYQARLDGPRTELLQQMVAAELARLECLVSADRGRTVAPEETKLDDVIGPLVARHRLNGVTVHWRPSEASAFVRAYEVAEIVNVLLTNAQRHATGAPVWVDVEEYRDRLQLFVEDGGSGVTPAIADSIFARGVRDPRSPGQGLGLHIAKRLAADLGGDLELVSPRIGHGACFALTLQSRPTSVPATAAEPSLLERAG
jgi:signal transduction histidine kinase